MNNKTVECTRHGIRRPAFVCQHLNLTIKVGFHEPYKDNLKNQDPFEEYQAWCDKCEDVRAKEGEWNDMSEEFANIKLICDKCFLEMKKLNNQSL